MCVCTISSGSRSLTKFKVDEDSSQKKTRHLRTLPLKTCHGFLSSCNNGYSYQSKTSNSSKWNILTNTVEPIGACLFVLMKLHMEGPTSALPL